MTREKAKAHLIAKCKCMEREVSGTDRIAYQEIVMNVICVMNKVRLENKSKH